jgi:hypothetical protein
MQSAAQAAPISRAALWIGRIMSGWLILFLLFDGTIKLIPLSIVTESMAQLGYDAGPNLARGLGLLTLLCVALYALPQTSFLGAILLTGLFGGATAAHLRIGSPVFSHLLFGFYLGLMAWGGLFLRDERLRSLLPFHKDKHGEIRDQAAAGG